MVGGRIVFHLGSGLVQEGARRRTGTIIRYGTGTVPEVPVPDCGNLVRYLYLVTYIPYPAVSLVWVSGGILQRKKQKFKLVTS